MTLQQFLISGWSWQPLSVLAGVAVLVAYGLTFHLELTRRAWFLAAACGVFVLALVSPIGTLSDGYLFSAHMLQHLLLQLVVPPLVLLSLPTSPMPRAALRGWLKPVTAILRRPLITWFLGLGAMWIWHVPSLCSASATNPWVHALQGVSLLLMGTAFWWPIIGPWRDQWLPPLLGVLYLFSACVGCTILGIILTFAPLGVCPVFMHPVDRLGILPLLEHEWGLTPARDQQLGGLLMWVPPCFVYLGGIFGMFARWYAGPDPEISAPADSNMEPEPPGVAHGHPLREEA